MATQVSTTGLVPALSVSELYPNMTNADKLVFIFMPSPEAGNMTLQPVIVNFIKTLNGGATDINTANYNDLPTGSVIIDATSTTKKLYFKTGATTWASVTLS